MAAAPRVGGAGVCRATAPSRLAAGSALGRSAGLWGKARSLLEQAAADAGTPTAARAQRVDRARRAGRTGRRRGAARRAAASRAPHARLPSESRCYNCPGSAAVAQLDRVLRLRTKGSWVRILPAAPHSQLCDRRLTSMPRRSFLFAERTARELHFGCTRLPMPRWCRPRESTICPTPRMSLWFRERVPAADRSGRSPERRSASTCMTAFACQETGGIWPVLRTPGLADTRASSSSASATRSDAVADRRWPARVPEEQGPSCSRCRGGDRMFEIARQGLVDMADHIRDYRGAAARPDKFCHGFGIFQLDLQFFKTQPDYFLEASLRATSICALPRCVGRAEGGAEAASAGRRRPSLSEAEMAAVAIAYNTGGFNPAARPEAGLLRRHQVLRRELPRLPQARQERAGRDAGGGASWRGDRERSRAVPAATTAARTGAAKKAAANENDRDEATAKSFREEGGDQVRDQEGRDQRRLRSRPKPPRAAPKQAAPKTVRRSAGAPAEAGLPPKSALTSPQVGARRPWRCARSRRRMRLRNFSSERLTVSGFFRPPRLRRTGRRRRRCRPRAAASPAC